MGFEPPQAVILDDGELVEVRSMLDDMQVPYVDGLPLRDDRPERAIPLLITTPEGARRLGSALPANYLHLVVAAEGDETADLPCDFLVRGAVEAAVLRLLTQRAGYEGPERRCMLRVAIGGAIGLYVEGEEFEAQLAQLSIGGCGLITQERPHEGAHACIAFPRERTLPRKLRINGRILSVRESKNGSAPPFDVSIAFDELALSDRVTLRALMAGQPIDFRPQPSLRVDPGPPSSAARAPRRRRSVVPEDGDRRTTPRRLYNRQLLGGSEGIARVLIGRDISIQGMRVEREARFTLGDQIKISIYGGVGVSPVLLKAVVERDDGAEGWFLRFAALSPAVEQDLNTLMESLAPVELSAGTGHIITEVLEPS
jgi:PilZ domain